MNLLIYIMFALCYDENAEMELQWWDDCICALKRHDCDLQKYPALSPLMQWELI